jgi:hypothetical protein
MEIASIVFEVIAVDPNITEVGHNEDIEIRAYKMIYEVLVVTRGIGEAKGHHSGYEHAIVSSAGYFRLLIFYNMDEGVCTSNV